jgi:hypothetical protein
MDFSMNLHFSAPNSRVKFTALHAAQPPMCGSVELDILAVLC